MNNEEDDEEDEEEEDEDEDDCGDGGDDDDDDDGMAWASKRIQEDSRRFSWSPNLSSQSVWDWPPKRISADLKDGIWR